MKLDELLERESVVSPRNPVSRDATRSALVAAAHEDIGRRARLVRMRRRRAVGVIAAAVVAVGGVVVARDLGPDHHAAPSTARSPITNTDFRTVAQVVDAAAAAPVVAGPGNAPYWKVVTRVPGSRQPVTYWIGLSRPGRQDMGFGHYIGSTGIERVSIDGNWMTWREANSRTWTNAQLRTIQFEGFNPTHGPWTRVPSWYRAGYDTGYALLTSPASHAMRQQLWKILGSLPEIRFDGRATDALGRKGWGLTVPSAGAGWPAESFIIDPATGVILEAKEHSPYSPGALTVVSAGPSETAPAPTPTCPSTVKVHTSRGSIAVCAAR